MKQKSYRRESTREPAAVAEGAAFGRSSGYGRKSFRPRELPTFYYHAHFLEMLDFVEKHYVHALDASQSRFRSDFEALSFSAQCLYVRMLNRRGRLFVRQRLRYPEIADIDAALAELSRAGFLARPGVDCVDEMLALMTRVELLGVLRQRLAGIRASAKKAELLALAREQFDAERLFSWLPTERVVAQGRAEDARFLLFLFFGRVQDGLTQFTMRDLGLVRSREPDEAYEARFSDREDAVHAYFFARRLEQLRRDGHKAQVLFAELHAWPEPQAPAAADFRDQLALELGRALEGDPDSALKVYRRGESVKCSERIIRLLLASGRREAAREYLERCIDSPSCDEEALLAADIYARKFEKKRTSALTDQLRDSEVIDIDEAWRGAPERAAAAWFTARGQQAFRVENGLWRTLFGLLFWDLLFGADSSGSHSPFERLPSALVERRFRSDNEAAIGERLALLEDRAGARRFLLRVSVARFGTPNGIFRWRQSILDAMYALIDTAPLEALRRVMLQFCDDYLSLRHGYPDLMVIDAAGPRFVEVKADGDQLRRNQLLRLEQLRRAGFRADVLRVRWVLHPDQPYVVVDVETTGGRGEQHRVTEIGAVRVVNGEIVGRFQTLLNPQRSIPPGITRLTGITPAMVAEAPVFADVADDFAEFLNDAIFVAHNVDFDYRFIGQEFRRLGRPFRMPKLCTCASMRRLYPGHKSYGLGALAAAYDIPLVTHHRALCDAEAAAQLLLMINEKRAQSLPA
ncbi:MAG: exonuclease domain-containing protein [Halieaceae bacterium]|nr:exonuclease domain-containing protein [Halieaceae bacterium]